MKPKAIVYTSNTGHTAAYAELLSERIDLPAYTLEEALQKLPKRSPIIYMGWIMAGKIKGYRRAAWRFNVCAACGVGMTAGGMNADRLRRATGVKDDIDVHAIPGGFELNKLSGMMYGMMKKTAAKVAGDLRAKQDRSPEEENMLMLMTRGAAQIDPAKLARLVEWYKKQ